MENLYEYLIINQINNDLDFLNDDQINEGKIKDKVKKVWNWVKGKFKRKKKKNQTNLNNDLNKIDINTENNNIDIKIYNYNDIKQEIYKNNELNANKKQIQNENKNKINILIAKYDNIIISAMFFIKHENYNRIDEFSQYTQYDHIFYITIDEDQNNKEDIYIKLLKSVIDEFKKSPRFKGITLDIDEYNSKKNFYNRYFNVESIKDKQIAVYKQ